MERKAENSGLLRHGLYNIARSERKNWRVDVLERIGNVSLIFTSSVFKFRSSISFYLAEQFIHIVSCLFVKVEKAL